MANSFLEYTGNGSTTAFSITFDYLDASHIACTVDGVSTSFTLSNGGTTATLAAAPANGAAIRFTRTTSQATRLTDYVAGSVLTETDLDTDSKQAFFMGQEGLDTIGTKMGQSISTFQFDALNKRITNVADPTSAQDAATKNYLENTWLSSTDKATLNSVNANIANINAVNSNSSNINSAVSNATNINTVATNIGSVNTVAADITKVVAVANDLAEAVSEVETVADDLNEATSEIDTVANAITNVDNVGNNIANVNSVASNATNINAVAGNATNINAVNSNSANINTVAGQNANITTLAGINANITTVAGIAANVTSVAGNETNINAVNSNSANINTVAGANSNITSVAGSIANVNTVATNLASVNSFANTYRISSSAPTTSLDVGDLYFDTTANELKVYKSSGWAAAGSTVNGTAQRYTYNITGTPTTVSGSDANGNTLAYDAGYADVYLNGIRMSSADITITSGTSVVFASALANGDVVDVVAYGTFNVASINAANIDAGTLNNARLPSTISDKTIEATALTAKGDGSSADGKITLNCSQNSHGVAIQSPAHSAGQSYTLILPTSVGSNGQVLATAGSNTNQLTWVDAQETKPTVANVSQTIAPATATTITITGTNFVSIPHVEFVKTDGSVTIANTVSFTSSTSLSVNVTLASGNYYVRIENPDGNAGRSTQNIITASTAPSFTTSAGSLGTIAGNFSGTVATIAGTSDSAITFSETTSVLTTANVTLNTSTGALTTTDFGGSSTTPTTYNFTIRITDAEGQTADRNFSLTSSFGATGGGQFN
ncbi:tail fiber [Pelagibacter phage HTVC200P]|nr:tail fiber [Pelagibacter phage HTVC200P]